MSTRGILLVLSVSLVLIGCALENLPYQDIPKVSTGSECLSDTSSVPQNYFDGLASVSEITSFWGCLGSVVQKFYTQTEGSIQRDSYSKREISRFIQDNFLSSSDLLTPQLIDNVMLAKRLVVGGSTNFVSKSELKALRYIFEKDLLEVSLQLKPHIHIYRLTEGMKVSESQHIAAFTQLSRAGHRLAKILSYSQNQIQIETFVNIINEFSKLLDGVGNQAAHDINQYLLLFSEVKALYLNSSSQVILPQEWGKLFSVVAVVYQEVARYNYFVKPDWSSKSGVTSLDQLHENFQKILKEAISYYPKSEIPVETINTVIAATYKAKISVLGMNEENFKSVVQKALSKIIIQNKNIQGFANQHLEVIKGLWTQFFEAQLYILGGERVDTPNIIKYEAVSFGGPWKLVYDQYDRLYFDFKNRDIIDVKSATFLNWERVLVELLIVAYSSNAKDLNLTELEALYWDIRPVLVGLDLIDSNDDDFFKGLYQEADLFVPRSNGDKKISLFEGVEYIHYVFAGIAAGKVYVDKILPHCQLFEKEGSGFFAPQCARHHLVSGFTHSLEHLSGFNDYYVALDLKKKNEINQDLLNIVWAEEDRELYLWTSDLKEQMALLQYVETVMLRFDTNRDGLLDLKEAMVAMPLFEKTLADIIGLDTKSEEDQKYIKALFTYMLKYSGIPDFNKPIDSLRFLDWRWHPEKWKVAASRYEIIKVLASLKKF